MALKGDFFGYGSRICWFAPPKLTRIFINYSSTYMPNTFFDSLSQFEVIKPFMTKKDFFSTFPWRVDETAWWKGTLLVTVDSILSCLRQSKMSKRRFIKVCYFSGARIHIFFYLIPLLHKKPNKMVLHIGINIKTNNSTFYSATEIVEEIG